MIKFLPPPLCSLLYRQIARYWWVSPQELVVIPDGNPKNRQARCEHLISPGLETRRHEPAIV